MTPTTFLDPFEETILHVLKQRNWQLVHPKLDQEAWNTFVRQVAEYLSESENLRQADEKRLDRSVIGAYCPILYDASGDHKSHRQIRAYEELWAWSYARIYHRVNDKQDALDVAQEVLLGIHRSLHKIDKPRGFLAWVNVIIRNQLHSYYRKNRKISGHEVGMSQAADELDESNTDEDITFETPYDCEISAAEMELLTMLDQCMTKRAQRQKFVFAQLVFCERSVLQVAEILNCTAGNIHLLFHRAKSNVLENCPKVVERLLTHLQPSVRTQYAGGEL